MKSILILFSALIFLCIEISAQVTCIYCFDQNGPVSNPVNNLLLNGGFENGCLAGSYFCPNSNGYSCNLTNWTCTGGGNLTYACALDNSILSSIIVEGTKAAYFGNYYCNPCSPTINDTLCVTDGPNCTVMGIPAGFPDNTFAGYGGDTGISLEQTVNGLIPGNFYVLEFWAGGESNGFNFANRGMFAVDVGFGKIFLRNRRTPSAGYIGIRYIIEFQAVSSSHTIRFTNWGHICYQCTELALDDVRLYVISELSESVPSCSTRLNENVENNFPIVSPNPFNSFLKINAGSGKTSQVILYDIMSRKIFQYNSDKSFQVSTEDFKPGIYFYEVRNTNGVKQKGKVVKE